MPREADQTTGNLPPRMCAVTHKSGGPLPWLFREIPGRSIRARDFPATRANAARLWTCVIECSHQSAMSSLQSLIVGATTYRPALHHCALPGGASLASSQPSQLSRRTAPSEAATPCSTFWLESNAEYEPASWLACGLMKRIKPSFCLFD
jgi:hypothetical protein